LPYLDYHHVENLTKFAEDNFVKVQAIPDHRGFLFKSILEQQYGFKAKHTMRPPS
jgi:hypothetical protein